MPQSTAGADPRDIEEVWERPAGQTSFATTFENRTGRNDIGRTFAIVIGLSDYKGSWKPIEAPWYDARRVRDALKGVGFDYIVTLTNKKATKETIRHYMEDVFPAKVGSEDRFLFYYSGHGTQRTLLNSVRGYLPMLDSQTEQWSSMIGMNEIATWSANVGQSRHSLFVLDSCFSGLAGEQAKGDTYIKVYLDDLLKPGHYLMTAGTEGQESRASVSKWGGSLFTDAFLNGIAGGADSGTAEFPADGIISVTKLYDYIRKRIGAEKASNPVVDQTPLVSDLTPKSVGEFFFLAKAGSVHARFSPAQGQGPISTKGRAVPTSDRPLMMPSEKVDQVYGRGLQEFPAWQFGKPLSALSGFTWAQLQPAGEFRRNDVRYLLQSISQALPSYRSYGCISPTSYVVFFFESSKFVRFSLRFLDEGVCPAHSVWLTHFANAVNASVQSKGPVRFFTAAGKQVQMFGASKDGLTQIDLFSSSSAGFMTLDEWLSFIAG